MTISTHILGWAHTKFGKHPGQDLEGLMAQVSEAAVTHAGLEPQDIDAISVGVFNNGFSRQGFEAALVGAGSPALAQIPATRYENACATGSAALHGAITQIEARRARAVLVIGAETMTNAPGAEANSNLLSASHRKSEEALGSFAGVFAQLADMYAERYGDPRKPMARVAAKNHRNGATNPYAHLRKDLGYDFCAKESDRNPTVVGRLLRTDCSMVSDGAAAMVLSSEDIALTSPRPTVAVRGRAQANESLALASRQDPLDFAGPRRAFHGALNEAGMSLNDLDFLETHDCFTIAEMLHYEAFGIAEPGGAGHVLEAGETDRDGRLPVNVSGGLKAKGHPIGATGVSQHIMAAMQLTGEAGDMQLRRASRAAVFNMGGSAVANYATVLESTI
ncbi:thiolase domain-containing protein [Nesterenkonia alkaliphila]|uniref:Thiolase domain-containing protein n=1 Tax=Nesterenkonia alkaliphila TaxID=1463631 RepID=A0A7K1UIJ1_9MICC|nr:thiolase domain-containing protein [Nesterenkonia alkaliphila]MVT26295.1 thiolase domain-containing protein [Nesterenkonia alkaliphila]GFZ99232.1 acetyl-CoA acetyltransferase [Nesterenkonia alkaliphila]